MAILFTVIERKAETYGVKGEALPTAYGRIWKAVARQEIIEQTHRKFKNPSRNNQAQKKVTEAGDVEVPDTLLADRATVHTVQSSLWQMFGEY